jgi:magnesium chelatase family protein
MAERVMNARSRAAFRNSRLGCEFNADIASEHLFAALGMGSAAFSSAIQKTFPAGTSNRGISRALRVARTLADLEDRALVTQEDIEQAAAWRPEMAAKMRGETL